MGNTLQGSSMNDENDATKQQTNAINKNYNTRRHRAQHHTRRHQARNERRKRANTLRRKRALNKPHRYS
jgi:hypothetical protein